MINSNFYVEVDAYNHNKNRTETLKFWGSTREQAEERYMDWRDKHTHYEVKTVSYYDNTR